MQSAPKSICLLRLSAIGDCCHALALVQQIQQHWPDTQITWVLGKLEAQLFSLLAPQVEFIVFDKNLGRAAYKNLRQQLKGRKFDVLLNLQASMRANLASLCIKAKQKIGYGHQRAREFQWLFTNKKAPISAGKHVAESFMDFASALGLPLVKPSWQLNLPSEATTWAQQQLDERPMFVLCPSASKAERNWTTQGYVALLNHAQYQGFKTVLIGSPAAQEIALGEEIMALTSKVDVNLIGKTSLIQLLALIQQASLVVAPDTGPAHLATLAATPVIGLYAAQTPERTGPYNDLDKVISVFAEALFAETGKTPEQVSWRTRVKAKDAMQRISIESVLTKFDQVVEQLNLLKAS